MQLLVPQLAGSVLDTQLPLQSWVPSGQTPPHDLPASRQTPAQGVVPPGHFEPHMVPSQVASPPVGALHAVQAVPQLAGLSLRRHCVPHRW